MPLVRIDLPAATPTDAVRAVSQAVHQALVDVFGVPEADRFQVIGRRAADELVCSPAYLGIEHGDQVVFVQVACSPGRTVAQKEELYERIATDIARGTDFRAADVIINLVETLRENWSFGNGIGHYAVHDRTRRRAS